MTTILLFLYRIGKFSNWVRTVQNKGKSTFVKNGAINTATLIVNNLKVLTDVVFTVSEAGDEVLMSRRDNGSELPCEKKSEQKRKRKHRNAKAQ